MGKISAINVVCSVYVTTQTFPNPVHFRFRTVAMQADTGSNCSEDDNALMLAATNSIVQRRQNTIKTNILSMAYNLESEYPWTKPANLLTRLPTTYPADAAFEARLQLLQARCFKVKHQDEDYTCNQLVFEHGGEFVVHAIYIRREDKLVEWDDSIYNVFNVSFACAKTFKVSSSAWEEPMTLLIVNHMTEWWKLFQPFGQRIALDAPLTHYNPIFLDFPRRQYTHKNLVVIDHVLDGSAVKKIDKAAFAFALQQSLMTTEQFDQYIKRASLRWRNCMTVSPQEAPFDHDANDVAASGIVTLMGNAHAFAPGQEKAAIREARDDTLHMEQMQRFGPSSHNSRLGKYASI